MTVAFSLEELGPQVCRAHHHSWQAQTIVQQACGFAQSDDEGAAKRVRLESSM